MAILLMPLVKLGTPSATTVLWVFNVLALCMFYFLSTRILQQYGFSERMSAIVMSVFMLVNAPILRNHVLHANKSACIKFHFFSLLIRRRSAFLSALSMTIAIQLKFSPALLVLAFLLERDWRWLAWLAVTTSVIFGLTLFANGFTPYLDFLFNMNLLNQPLFPNFRNTSIRLPSLAAGRLSQYQFYMGTCHDLRLQSSFGNQRIFYHLPYNKKPFTLQWRDAIPV